MDRVVDGVKQQQHLQHTSNTFRGKYQDQPPTVDNMHTSAHLNSLDVWHPRVPTQVRVRDAQQFGRLLMPAHVLHATTYTRVGPAPRRRLCRCPGSCAPENGNGAAIGACKHVTVQLGRRRDADTLEHVDCETIEKHVVLLHNVEHGGPEAAVAPAQTRTHPDILSHTPITSTA